MGYLVVGADGKEYGPVDVATLAQWAKDDRVRPNSTLKDLNTGRTITAQEVPGLFQPIVQPQQPTPYAPPAPGQYAQPQYRAAYQDGGEANGAFLWAIIDSVLAVVGFYLLHTLGLIFAAFALINAFRAKSGGHRFGWFAIGLAVIAAIAVGIGWVGRLQGRNSTPASSLDVPAVMSLR